MPAITAIAPRQDRPAAEGQIESRTGGESKCNVFVDEFIRWILPSAGMVLQNVSNLRPACFCGFFFA